MTDEQERLVICVARALRLHLHATGSDVVGDLDAALGPFDEPGVDDTEALRKFLAGARH